MILIAISLIFLLVGVWRYGQKLAIALFLGLLALGVWDLRQGNPGAFWPSRPADLLPYAGDPNWNEQPTFEDYTR